MYLERIFQQNPDTVAVRSVGIVYTYGQLYKEASRLAAFLKHREEPLLVYGHKHPRMIVSLLACLLCGRAWVPCDSSLPEERIKEIAKLCGTSTAFLAEEIDVPSGLSVFSWDDVPNSTESYTFSFRAERTAYIMFTSGTTGTPKGIPITISNVENFASWLLSHQELCQEQIINQANLSFDLSVADWCAALCRGATLLLTTKAEQFDLTRFFARIQEQTNCLLVCTPTFLRLCLCDRSFCQEQLPALNAVFLCGEVLPTTTARLTLKRFPELYLFNAYGPTEATCAVCGLQITDEYLLSDPLPVGKISSAAVEITLINDEICLNGASVFHSYLNQPAIDMPYHSGDFGQIDNDLLFCLGRKDSQIKYMGYRIDLAEIRLALESLPEIQQADVIAQKDVTGTVRHLAAYLSPLPSDTERLRCQLAKKLPSYMLPSLFFPLEQLPVTPNVKVKAR